MYLIVGLGNPEEEYSGTRHNMGFDTINKICKNYDIKITKNKFNGLYAVCVGAYKDKNKADAIVKELKEKGYTSTYLIIR